MKIFAYFRGVFRRETPIILLEAPVETATDKETDQTAENAITSHNTGTTATNALTEIQTGISRIPTTTSNETQTTTTLLDGKKA